MDAHKNLAVSTVATAPSPASSGTSLVVATGEGTRFPAVPFNATVWPSDALPDPSNAEIVRVTAVSTDTLTITRAQESTSARSIVVGDLIAATITAKTLTDIETAIPGALAILEDQKSAGTSGGGPLTTGSFQTHTLNTEVTDADGIVSLSSNQFTLPAGTYEIRAWATHYQTNRFKLRIYNVTDSDDPIYGQSGFSLAGANQAQSVHLEGKVTIAASKVFELQYRAEAAGDSRALGVESNMGVVEVFAHVAIRKVA